MSIEKGYIVNLNPATGEAIQPKVKVSTNAEVDAAVAAGCDLMYCGTDLAGVASSWETLLNALPPPVEPA